jgi:hypothetical protein
MIKRQPFGFLTFLALMLISSSLMASIAAAQDTGPRVLVDVQSPDASTVQVTFKLAQVQNLYGIETRCAVDPLVLAGTTRADGDGFNQGNSLFVDQGYNATSGEWLIAATRMRPHEPIAGDLNAFSLNYTVQQPGESNVNCTIQGVDPAGAALPLTVVNGTYVQTLPDDLASFTLEAPDLQIDPTRPSTVAGNVAMQNAPDNSGIVVQLLQAGNVYAQTNAQVNGSFTFSEVPMGSYVLYASAPNHVGLLRNVLVKEDGKLVDLGQNLLLAGDTDGNGTVDVVDASFVGANYNLQSPPAPLSVDLNSDDVVNVGDLVLVGSNFGAAVTATPVAADKQFRLAAIDISAAEIINPGRGYYRWRGSEAISSMGPAQEAYERYQWRALEPRQGVYDFSSIDRDIARAASEGRRFSFRVRDFTTDPIAVPDYMRRYTWLYKGQYVPNWNNNFYKSRVQALLNALGQRYNNDARVHWVDIGMYGYWGEWHVHGMNYSQAPSGIRTATADTLKQIVDMHVNAFPSKQLLMGWGSTDPAVVTAVTYAMQHPTVSRPIGIRNDCLGMMGSKEHFRFMAQTPQWAAMRDRWRVAPVVTEYCNTAPGDGGFAAALNQIRDFHVSLIGNGNFPRNDFSAFSSTEQANAILAGKIAGFRYRLNNIALPTTISRSAPFRMTASWSNIGVAPTYDQWHVYIQLRNANGGVAWEGISSVNLRTLLPTSNSSGADTPVTINDVFTVDPYLPPGTYGVVLIIKDPKGQLRPLAISNQGRNQYGNYYLGQVTVQ